MNNKNNVNQSKRHLLLGAAASAGVVAVSKTATASNQLPTQATKVNVKDYGCVGDGTTDDTSALQAVFNSYNDIYVPKGNYLVSDTLIVPSNTKIEGAGKSTTFVGGNNTKPVLMTFDGVSLDTNDEQTLRDFNIGGEGSCAVAFVHQTTSVVENVTCDGFSGQNGFVFEYCWSNKYSNLKTNGASISHSAFQFNKVVLDCMCELFYTSNLCEFSIKLDRDAQQYSVGNAVGLGNIQFNMPTIQGANQVGFFSNYNNVSVYNMYTENNARIVQVGEVGTAVAANTSFYSSRLNGGRTGVSDIQIENVSSVSFYDCDFHYYPLVIGGGSLADIQFYTPRVTSNGDFLSVLKREDSTLSSFPVTIHRQVGTHYSELVMKSTGWGWNMQRMSVDATGKWQATSWTPPKV